ncbi:MAG: hypothetical protein ABJG15_12155 [Hyphomonadaceae bacterium]
MHIWTKRLARGCQALIIGIILGYLVFAISAWFGDKFDTIGSLAGLAAQLLCALLFLIAIAGIITNIRQTPAQHILTFIVSLAVSLSIIPFGIIFLSQYGY